MRMSFEPSTATRVRLATISEGEARSSRIASWTAVKVRDLGRGCLGLERRLGTGRIRRWATKTTWRSENFFSSSRVTRAWILAQAFWAGTGTKIMTAFLPLPISTYHHHHHQYHILWSLSIHLLTSLAAVIWRGRRSFFNSGTLFSKSTRAWATVSSNSVVGCAPATLAILWEAMLDKTKDANTTHVSERLFSFKQWVVSSQLPHSSHSQCGMAMACWNAKGRIKVHPSNCCIIHNSSIDML